MSYFNIDLSSFDKQVNFQDCSKVILQSASGKIEILPNHAKIITALDVGFLEIEQNKSAKNEKGIKRFLFLGGLVEFNKNNLQVTTSDFVDMQLESFDNLLLREQKEKIDQLIKQALQGSKFYEIQSDLLYLMQEEILAKVELYKNL